MYAALGAVTPPVTWYTIPHGDAGTWATVAELRRLAHQAARDPQFQRTARAVTAGNPFQLRQWLDRHFRFRRDPPSYEAVWTPRVQLEQIARTGISRGDCDDAAVLGAALALAAGLPRVRFVLLGFGPAPVPFTHIYADAAGVELDVTRPQQVTAPATRRAVVEV